ncbi:PHA2 (YNL316C) [Zygosaccharomyces parabailii]|uniref:prephenate dehydratase n=1 Tax=Zygosaccharomyces bailii (strain CLIB 213 / ATCC 58445 / CBS 680 / BCRC 21525 / NBRC 1098 / NCYC 1416 / NRRL Y-2227) TaxID=1333698 RepID=A0A8J2T3Z1_ZYGB2|nr:PHA2 (YNL316C) [Zygosaccharomyces parabailii]CDF87369.1 BN860_04830g1_1 [Zygosaccharomyces bailii CLIB 213]CDH15566.1 related to PHA2-Prephenate dehydratase [Zygosaccharomyces bailii ISA1307]SJM84997.1 related to Putative prephenate dehydratase [Zygosaccharomyces bailii]
MVKTLFLGPKGTYSHQAALQQFGNRTDVEYVAADSIPKCIEKLKDDHTIDYSVIPLENSTNGQVVFSYDLLRDLMVEEAKLTTEGNRVVSSLEVIGEQYVAIVHCLIAAQLIKLELLHTYQKVVLHSHPQVWGQVSDYLAHLRQQCPHTSFEKVDSSSTSEAVKIAVECQSKSAPGVIHIAIAGEVAAKLNHCEVLDYAINDRKNNTTRFLVLQRRAEAAPSRTPHQSQVSLVSFTTKHDDPGSLVDVLSILKTHSINMCSINSRPLNRGTQKWQYVFFIEYYYAEPRNWDAFFKEIGSVCSYWCLWGTFPRNERYYE